MPTETTTAEAVTDETVPAETKVTASSETSLETAASEANESEISDAQDRSANVSEASNADAAASETASSATAAATTAEPTAEPTPEPTKNEMVKIAGLKDMTQEEYRIYQKVVNNYYIGARAAKGSSGYGGGWCTWYVYNARMNVGKWLPNNLSHAYRWPDRARSRGLRVDRTPEVGAVACDPANNHVMFVEAVYANGNILISEGGWNYSAYCYNKRVIRASRAANFKYIH